MLNFVTAQLRSYVCPNMFAVNGPDRSVPDPVDASIVIAISVNGPDRSVPDLVDASIVIAISVSE